MGISCAHGVGEAKVPNLDLIQYLLPELLVCNGWFLHSYSDLNNNTKIFCKFEVGILHILLIICCNDYAGFIWIYI